MIFYFFKLVIGKFYFNSLFRVSNFKTMLTFFSDQVTNSKNKINRILELVTQFVTSQRAA